MFWFRVDNRLVHGQVVETWLPYLNARQLVVVSDALATDPLQQTIMQLAIPARISVRFIGADEARALYDQLSARDVPALFLLVDCRDALRIVECGIPMPVLNIGNLHYARGKRQICTHVAVSEEDIQCLEALKRQGTVFDFRSVPNETPVVEDW